jgi:predicted DNA-binding ribbon-helix-helix protein
MKKHSVVIHGHSTSITLEDAFWHALKTEAQKQKTSLNKLIAQIDDKRAVSQEKQNLSSAIRLYILKTLQSRLNEESP